MQRFFGSFARTLGGAALLNVVAQLGCSTAPATGNEPVGPDGSATANPADDAGARVDTGTQDPSDASSPDTSEVGSPSTPAPQPPTGYTPCGSGTITPANTKTACLKTGPFPSGTAPRQCDLATLSGGQWKKWCGPLVNGSMRGLYVWAELDGLVQTAASGCPSSVPQLYGVEHALGSGSGNTPGVVFQEPMWTTAYVEYASPYESASSGLLWIDGAHRTASACTSLSPVSILFGIDL